MEAQPINDAATYMAVVRRRPVGKGAWRVSLTELIESERECLRHLRAIGDRYPNDNELLRHVNKVVLESAQRIALLSELMQYKGDTDSCEGQDKAAG